MTNAIFQAELGGIIQELLRDKEATRGFLECINKIKMYSKSERLDNKTKRCVTDAYFMICGGISHYVPEIIEHLEKALLEDEKD